MVYRAEESIFPTVLWKQNKKKQQIELHLGRRLIMDEPNLSNFYISLYLILLVAFTKFLLKLLPK